MTRLVNLVEWGYAIRVDREQPGAWHWTHPFPIVDRSEAFASQREAVDSAWLDAQSEGRSFIQASELEWEALTEREQLAAMRGALMGQEESLPA